MKNSSLKILKVLFDTRERLTASQIGLSNANQYLGKLEKQELIKRIEIPREGNTPFKVGFVDDDTRDKAENYLKSRNYLNVKTPIEILNGKTLENMF